MQKILLNQDSVVTALQGSPGRKQREAIAQIIMLTCAIFCILVTIGIVIVLVEIAYQFFVNEFFLESGILRRVAAELAQQQGLSGNDLQAVISLAVDTREVTFEKIVDQIPGLTLEQLQAAFDQMKSSTTGLNAFWISISSSISRFFLDTRWTPLFSSKRFGIWPLVNGTVMVSFVAMLVAVPFGLLTAIYLGLYAKKEVSTYLRPVVELLAGIPTVVYGYFALLYISPIIQFIFKDAPIFNVLSAGLMMGVMIIPTVSSLSLDAITSVPRTLHDGAYALGATKMEVVLKVVMPAAISGIAASVILGISRAVGETMIVTIAAGQQPVFYGQSIGEAVGSIFNPVQSMATMTAFIAQVALGDAPAGSIQYETLYAVGCTLFVMTLTMNLLGQFISSKFREVYE